MNFRERLTELELAMVHARSSNDTKTLRELERQHDDLLAIAWDEAYMQAVELGSPNSAEFDSLHEQIYEGMLS